MNAITPLMTLLGQVERERDQLAADCQRAVAAHQAAAAQAEQLRDYRRDYEQRWSAQFRVDGPIELVTCYRGFMERLSQAVDQQQRAAALAESLLEGARVSLREAEIRVASVRKLIERRVAEVRLAADRREQKATDEFAARVAWSALTAGTGFAGVS